MTPVAHARAVLSWVRERTGTVLVAFSGGKDSLACMDLCAEAGLDVVPFFLYIVEGISFQERMIEWCERRYGVTVRRYPHPLLAEYLKCGIFRSTTRPDIPAYSWGALEKAIMRETQTERMVIGWKQSDSLQRRIVLRQYDMQAIGPNGRICPLSMWGDKHVRAYLQARRLPKPESFGRQGDVTLMARAVAILAERHPDDYQRLLRIFPQAGAQLARREFYGAPERSKYEGT